MFQASSYCFCGDSYGSFGEADGCSLSCHGDSSQTCGGSWRNSVYSLSTEGKMSRGRGNISQERGDTSSGAVGLLIRLNLKALNYFSRTYMNI